MIFIFYILPFYINIPSVYVPTRWSDFEFWSRTFQTIKYNKQQLEVLSGLHTNFIQNNLFKILMTSCISALLLFSIASISIRQKSLEELFIYEITTIVAIFLSIVIIGRVGTSIIPFIWIFYILIRRL